MITRSRSRTALTGPAPKSTEIVSPPVCGGAIPWGDVFTAYYSTGIPSIEDYVAAPPALQRQLAIGRMIAPWTKWAPIRNLLLMAVRPGPSAELRARTATHVWGEVADDQGRRAVSRLHGPEAGLVWTTITALGAAQKALNGAAKAGYQTPTSALGKDFVLEGEAVTRADVGNFDSAQRAQQPGRERFTATGSEPRGRFASSRPTAPTPCRS